VFSFFFFPFFSPFFLFILKKQRKSMIPPPFTPLALASSELEVLSPSVAANSWQETGVGFPVYRTHTREVAGDKKKK